MNEAWINLNSSQSAARLMLKSVSANSGIGIAHLSFQVELASREAVADNQPLWVSGTVRAKELVANSGHLGVLRTTIQPLHLPERGGSRDATFMCDLTDRQLQVIEANRTGSITLTLEFSGNWLIEGSPVPFWSCHLEYEIKQSDWIVMLEQMGYRRTMLLEFDVPDAQGSNNYAKAFEYFREAQTHYLEGKWRQTVESLRQTLAALVGKRADDEDDEMAVMGSVKDLRKESGSRNVGYGDRYEPVRMAMKFMADLGAHPEVTETERRDANAALLMVAGLLQGYRRT